MTRRLAAVLAVLVLAPSAAAAAHVARPVAARRLYVSATTHLAVGTFDSRRAALAELEQATLMDPGNAEYELTLARAYYKSGYLKSARTRFERVARLAPDDAASRFGLGLVWRRDWLKYLEAVSLDHAVQNLSVAARLDPAAADAWLQLTPLLIEQGRLAAARAAAEHALAVRPDEPEAELAVASTAYRGGEIARAESLFERAIPRLRRDVRERFEDIAPLASERDTMALHQLGLIGQLDFKRRFWREHDPDPATPENEVELEYWSRCAQAFFLYYDTKHESWDERGEVYVRYGPPEREEYNPPGSSNNVEFGHGTSFVSDFPANTLVWRYPDLGMTVTMLDRVLTEHYSLPVHLTEDPDPRPDPAVLAARDDAMATHDMRGVFPLLPPGAHALPVSGSVTRFGGAVRPRVLGAAEAPGQPGDSLWATWVVADSTEIEVARTTRTLSPSACDPAEYRVADFMDELPPGEYHVAVSVRSSRGARGVYRETLRLDPDPGNLALSDVMISCGPPDLAGVPVRPAANPEAVVGADQPLTAYFEIYHLLPGESGRARFEVVYTVRSAEKDARIWIQRLLSPRPAIPQISASREEENAGPLRRQFLSVPVQALPAGRYWLEVAVRDRGTQTQAERRTLFVKLAAPTARSETAAPHGGS